MPRKRRNLKVGYSYHITIRCNNREFKLARREYRHGFFYDFSNYGSYERLTDDGLTQWHPAFLRLGDTLEECARKYKGFCQKYKPKEKNLSKCHWGSRLLAGVHLSEKCSTTNPNNKSRFSPPPCQVTENEELTRVVRQFIQANRAVNEEGKEF